MTEQLDCGMVGLSVMGRSLALNLCDHGYRVGGFNRSSEVTETLLKRWPNKNFTPYYDLEKLIKELQRPRKLFLMVKAGAPVDALLDQVMPLLEEGDIILDCGNSHYTDTGRRCARAKEQGLFYFGVGVSGGEEGARLGPAIMPGGDLDTYNLHLRSMLEDIAAKAPDGSPCCSYMGPEGAGHFVKMVHNGIEYADMQLISEAYLLLKYIGGLDNSSMSELFAKWNQGELQSFLVQITADILCEPDDLAAGELLDNIVDGAEQKGTGRWTTIEALNLNTNVSMITAAVDARIISNAHELRKTTVDLVGGPSPAEVQDADTYAEAIRCALYGAKTLVYSQGIRLIQNAFAEYGWTADVEKIAGVFRAGCIIRSVFLDDIMSAYRENPALELLINAPEISKKLADYQGSMRQVIKSAVENGLPVPVFAAGVSYLDALRGQQVGANLLQAQRDYFGAHTYRRTDREGVFHHEWGGHNE